MGRDCLHEGESQLLSLIEVKEKATHINSDKSSYRPDTDKDDGVAVKVLATVDEPGENDGEDHGKDGTGSVEQVGACSG
jgi:hypothetical protein